MDNDIVPQKQQPQAAAHKPKKAKMNVRQWLVMAVAAVLVLGAAGAAWCLSHRGFNENTQVNTKEYQAVFLTNGQVYFGKLADLGHRYVTITDIFYLQVQQDTPGTNKLHYASGDAATGAQLSLAKLGSELHGPEDKMSVSSDQILFWENLKSDSKVVQAIQRYQNQ